MPKFPTMFSFLALLIGGSVFAQNGVFAQDMAPLGQSTSDLVGQISAGRQEVEFARDRLRFYQNDEYPAQIRRRDHAIEVAEAAERALARRIDDYQVFERWKYSRPFHYSIEEWRIAHLQAQHAVRELKDERFLYIREHANRYRFLERDVKMAEERLRMLFAALNAQK